MILLDIVINKGEGINIKEVEELINGLKEIHTTIKEQNEMIQKMKNCWNCQFPYIKEICSECKNLDRWCLKS